MTPAERRRAFERERARRLRARTRIVLDTRAEILAQLKEAEQQILAALAQQPAEAAAWRLQELQREVRRAMDEFGRDSGPRGAAGLERAWRAGGELVDEPLRAAAIAVEGLAAVNTRALEAMREFMTEKIRGITVEAANRINTQLAMVLIGANQPADAVGAVKNILGENTRRRAVTIVATELNRAFGAAAYARLQEVAPRVPGMRKIWRRSGKRHSRPEHDAADGQVQPWDEPFKFSAKEGKYELRYPVDPKGPAHGTINCFAPGTRISGRVVRAFRMAYEGPLLVLETAAGRQLAVTPNHPILTLRGFVDAKALRPGQQVLCYRDGVDGIATGGGAADAHVVQGDALIEEVFGALSQRGAQRVIVSPHDFHGDAKYGREQIEVVATERVLATDHKSASAEGLRDARFAHAGVRESPCAGDGALVLDVVGVGTAATGGPGGGELPVHGRDALFAQPRPYDPALIGRAADLDASLHEMPLDGAPADAELARELLYRFAGRVALDEIKAVRRIEFDGHVYDVECEGGFIVAGGVIASNCGCTLLPLLPESSGLVPTLPRKKPFTAEEIAADQFRADLADRVPVRGPR